MPQLWWFLSQVMNLRYISPMTDITTQFKYSRTKTKSFSCCNQSSDHLHFSLPLGPSVSLVIHERTAILQGTQTCKVHCSSRVLSLGITHNSPYVVMVLKPGCSTTYQIFKICKKWLQAEGLFPAVELIKLQGSYCLWKRLNVGHKYCTEGSLH